MTQPGTRAHRLLWGMLGLVGIGLAVAIGPALLGSWRCVANFSGGPVLRAEVVHLGDAGGVMRLAGRTDDAIETCTVPRGELASTVVTGAFIDVIRHRSLPERCTTVATLEASRALVVAATATAGVALLLLWLAGRFLQRSLFERGAPTTRLELSEAGCPRCEKPMCRGYLPLLAGIHWREADEPMGLPHALGGLPGTVGWKTRPRLEALRCEPCELVLFRYGKPRTR